MEKTNEMVVKHILCKKCSYWQLRWEFQQVCRAVVCYNPSWNIYYSSKISEYVMPRFFGQNPVYIDQCESLNQSVSLLKKTLNS